MLRSTSEAASRTVGRDLNVTSTRSFRQGRHLDCVNVSSSSAGSIWARQAPRMRDERCPPIFVGILRKQTVLSRPLLKWMKWYIMIILVLCVTLPRISCQWLFNHGRFCLITGLLISRQSYGCKKCVETHFYVIYRQILCDLEANLAHLGRSVSASFLCFITRYCKNAPKSLAVFDMQTWTI